eukprot:4000346-Pyramimonas_sp.AAC.2
MKYTSSTQPSLIPWGQACAALVCLCTNAVSLSMLCSWRRSAYLYRRTSYSFSDLITASCRCVRCCTCAPHTQTARRSKSASVSGSMYHTSTKPVRAAYKV